MSIVKMKALTLLAPSKDVKLLLRTLQHFGCVEVSEAEAEEGFLPLESRSAMLRTFSRDVQAALDTMNSYVPAKKSMFAPRRPNYSLLKQPVGPRAWRAALGCMPCCA